ncbi:MAG: hypothetical protein HQ546_11595 [Planctomycetes bacterium]|nr:hypothetical protein [Planctomycetota bacterium]
MDNNFCKPTIVDVCSRVRQLRVEYAGARGKAAFAREIGISPTTYDTYEKLRLPPATVLVRIADLTHTDLRWLLTGKEGPAPIPPGHPVIARAARLLANRPKCASALAAFVDLLAEAAEKFPDADLAVGKGTTQTQNLASPPEQAAGKENAETPRTKIAPSKAAEDAPAEAPTGDTDVTDGVPSSDRQGWIPVIGRSAAGIPHFWQDIGGDSKGVTMLADLVAAMKPRPARFLGRAEAVGVLAADGSTVQMVLLDTPEAPGTAEFVIAEHIASKYDATFAVRIDGESMEPEICHGDVVLLCPSYPAEQGKPAVVQLVDQIGVTCKLYRSERDGIHLIPINERFSPAAYRPDQVVWALKVIARVRPV